MCKRLARVGILSKNNLKSLRSVEYNKPKISTSASNILFNFFTPFVCLISSIIFLVADIDLSMIDHMKQIAVQAMK